MPPAPTSPCLPIPATRGTATGTARSQRESPGASCPGLRRSATLWPVRRTKVRASKYACTRTATPTTVVTSLDLPSGRTFWVILFCDLRWADVLSDTVLRFTVSGLFESYCSAIYDERTFWVILFCDLRWADFLSDTVLRFTVSRLFEWYCSAIYGERTFWVILFCDLRWADLLSDTVLRFTVSRLFEWYCYAIYGEWTFWVILFCDLRWADFLSDTVLRFTVSRLFEWYCSAIYGERTFWVILFCDLRWVDLHVPIWPSRKMSLFITGIIGVIIPDTMHSNVSLTLD